MRKTLKRKREFLMKCDCGPPLWARLSVTLIAQALLNESNGVRVEVGPWEFCILLMSAAPSSRANYLREHMRDNLSERERVGADLRGCYAALDVIGKKNNSLVKSLLSITHVCTHLSNSVCLHNNWLSGFQTTHRRSWTQR